MAYFRDRSDSELNAFTDEELVAHMHEARRRGHADAELRAVQILAYKLGKALEPRLLLALNGLPRSAFEEVRDKIIDSLLDTEIEGETVGQVRALANTVFKRRVADFFRKNRPQTTELAEENLDDDDEGPSGAIISESDETGAVEVRMVADDVLATRSVIHARVIHLYLESIPSKRIAEMIDAEFEGDPGVPMSDANVDQIARRFRKDIDEALGGGS